MNKSGIVHAMTVDVEDYFHVAALAEKVKPQQWGDMPSRVESSTQTLLGLFEEKGIKATFFILGWVAERNPALVREIHAAGHEIASHGYSHQLVYAQTPEVFKEETERSKKLLEDLSGASVTGYRAASYSITRHSLWALDILAELGFTWDSSIFPVRHDRYGIPRSPTSPYKLITPNRSTLKELPLTAARVMGASIPAAGGGYFRQYPLALSKWLFRRASEGETKPQIFYLHPWEVDPDQPRIDGLSWLSRFRHYTNLRKCLPRLEKMIDEFHFSTVSESLGSVPIDIEFDTAKIR